MLSKMLKEKGQKGRAKSRGHGGGRKESLTCEGSLWCLCGKAPPSQQSCRSVEGHQEPSKQREKVDLKVDNMFHESS